MRFFEVNCCRPRFVACYSAFLEYKGAPIGNEKQAHCPFFEQMPRAHNAHRYFQWMLYYIYIVEDPNGCDAEVNETMAVHCKPSGVTVDSNTTAPSSLEEQCSPPLDS